MDKEKFKEMKKWETMMALFGVTMEGIYDSDSWQMEDDSDYRHVLETLHTIEKWKAKPTMSVQAALRTMEMGITEDDVDDYYDELCDLDAQDRIKEAERLITENPALKVINGECGFTWIDHPKKYPRHKHFSFNTKNGVEVTCRMFRVSWRSSRVWVCFRDKNGKLVSQQHNTDLGVEIPKSFPEAWRGYHSTESHEIIPYIIAHHVVTKTMPKNYFGGNFVYPKK